MLRRWVATVAFTIVECSVICGTLAPAQELPEPDKAKTVEMFRVPNYCEGVVFDHAGNGYISWGKTITRFTLDGKHAPWAETGAPNGHKILADGTHLVCDASQHAVPRQRREPRDDRRVRRLRDLRSAAHRVDTPEGGAPPREPDAGCGLLHGCGSRRGSVASPLPLFSSTCRSLDLMFVTTASSRPSRSRSATATIRGTLPTAMFWRGRKPPRPSAMSREIVSAPVFVLTRSGQPSPSMSAATAWRTPAP